MYNTSGSKKSAEKRNIFYEGLDVFRCKLPDRRPYGGLSGRDGIAVGYGLLRC